MANARIQIPFKGVQQSYNSILEIPNGYLLEQDGIGWLSAVIPLESTNWIVNPGLEDIGPIDGNPDGYFENASFLGATQTYQRGGPYGTYSWLFEDIPAVIGGDTIEYSGLNTIPQGQYVFSVVVRGQGTFRLLVREDTSAIIHDTGIFTIESRDQWQQYSNYHITTTADDTLTFILEWLSGPTLEIGWFQGESNADNVATTPFYGFSSGYQFESPDVYRWNGVAYRSESIRSVDTITGGVEVNLHEEFGLCINEAEGFGIPEELEVIASPYALRQGSLVRCKTITERTLTINAQLIKCSFKDLLCARNSVGRAIFSRKNLRKFIWQPIVNCELCPCVEFVACLTSGFQGVYDNLYGENIDFDLTMYDPNFYSCYRQTEILETRNTEEFSALVAIDNQGNAQDPLQTGINQPDIQGQNFYDYCISPYDGNLYYTFQDTGLTRVLNCFDGTTHTEVATFAAGNNAAGHFDNVLRLSCCRNMLYVGGHFTSANASAGWLGVSGSSIAQIDLTNNLVNNIGNVSQGALNGQVTSIECVDTSVGEIVIGGLFDTAGGVAALNLSRFDGTTFVTNNFPIGNEAAGGRINQTLHWEVNQQLRVLYGGSFQNNFTAGHGDVNVLLPEMLGYFEQGRTTGVSKTDFSFSFGAPTVPVDTVTSIARLNDTIFVGGNFNQDNAHSVYWSNNSISRAREIRGIAVFDANQEQNVITPIIGRLLPLNGESDPPVPTGQGTDGTRPTTIFNGQPNLIEMVRDMEVINGELYVVGSLTEFGLIDSTNAPFDIIDPMTEVCGGFIWTPNPNDARFGTVRPLDLDVQGVDLNAVPCRVVAIKGTPVNAPQHLNYSHIYQLAANQDNLAQFETGGNTEITLCIDDMKDASYRIHVEGPGQLRSITVNDSIVFDSSNNPIPIGGGETFIADFESIPASFSLSDGTLITGQNFRQSTIDGPTTNINIRFAPSTIENPIAYLTYKPQSISSEEIICSSCT